MSKVLVVTVLVSIVSEKVTETVDVIETDVSPSEGVLDDTVGGVVSVLFEPSSLLLQEMMLKLKRNTEKIMSICFIVYWFRRTLLIPELGVFYKEVGILLGGLISYENKNSVKKYIPSRTNIMIRKSFHFILWVVHFL